MVVPGVLTIGEITIDPQSFTVFSKENSISLPKKEFELLEFLAKNKDRVINRLTIMEQVWNYGPFSNTNTLDVHIGALRKKLEKFFGKKIIKTIYGLGYKVSENY